MTASRLIHPSHSIRSSPGPRVFFGGAPLPQPVPGMPAPPPPSETPPEVIDPPVPHEHEPVRDPLPVERNANVVLH